MMFINQKDILNIMLRVHIKDGPIYDFTNILNSVTWSGDTRDPARTLEFSYFQPPLDDKFPKRNVLLNSSCCFYVNNVEIFRGNCKSISKSAGGGFTATFKDICDKLLDEKSYNFHNVTACDIAKKVLKENKPPLQLDKIAPAGTKITKMFIGATGQDIILSAYTMHSKAIQGKKKYMLKADLNKINIVERGVNFVNVEFAEGKNLYNVSYSESLDGFKNRVLIVDDKGNKKSEKIDKELMKIYNGYMTHVVQVKEGQTAPAPEGYFVKPTKSITLDGWGDISCITGMKVNVKDSTTGVTGVFYIDKDTHTWSNGLYENSLELNFENIMDERESGEDEEKKSANGSGLGEATTDWGHGITAAMLNKVFKGKLAGKGDLFIKYCNMYKVNPAVAAAISCHESAAGTSQMATDGRNNFFGMRSKNGWMHFKSVEEGIKRGIANISKRYVNKGKKSLKGMVKDYAENGAYWISQTESFCTKICGKKTTQLNWGTGVKTDAEAKNNIKYAAVKPGSSIVETAIAYATSKIGYKYDQDKRMTPEYFDCSSLCYRSYAAAGVYNPKKWAFTTSEIDKNHSAYGLKKYPLSQAKRGDILWKKGHAGLYIGGGRTIEAMNWQLGVRYGKSNRFNCAYRYVGK